MITIIQPKLIVLSGEIDVAEKKASEIFDLMLIKSGFSNDILRGHLDMRFRLVVRLLKAIHGEITFQDVLEAIINRRVLIEATNKFRMYFFECEFAELIDALLLETIESHYLRLLQKVASQFSFVEKE